jgi:hypothetical protein
MKYKAPREIIMFAVRLNLTDSPKKMLTLLVDVALIKQKMKHFL